MDEVDFSLLDQIAVAAMAAIITADGPHHRDEDVLARRAYKAAEAMLNERDRRYRGNSEEQLLVES